MSTTTAIQWTDKTWNPVTGCTKISAGCRHCYAETIAERFWRPRKFADVVMHEDRLDQPLRWRKPARVFVNSMSDLFHEAVSDEFIARAFDVMGRAQRHTFQVLTKRPARMLEWVRRWDAGHPATYPLMGHRFPLPNVHLGVSVENQEAANERIPLLLETPAAVWFLSVEPLLGPVNLCAFQPFRYVAYRAGSPDSVFGILGGRLDWVIVGGESGPGARPCDVAWIRSIVEQCRAASVPCFVKQLGAASMDVPPPPPGGRYAPGEQPGQRWRMCLRDRKGGDPAEWPADLRVREFPEAPEA